MKIQDTPQQIYFADQTKEDETDWACGAHGREGGSEIYKTIWL
jgi:hypothetical protein